MTMTISLIGIMFVFLNPIFHINSNSNPDPYYCQGHTIYSGAASESVAYFSTNGFACQEFYNPSDFFLDILSPDSRSPELEQESSSRIKLLSGQWADSGPRIMVGLGLGLRSKLGLE
jgi:hypothetical protein